jgi:peptide chain release factor subunit 1
MAYAPPVSESQRADVSPTWATVRELAAYRTETAVCLTIYLDIDPRQAPTAADLTTQMHSLFHTATLAERELKELSHAEREGLDAALEQVAVYLADFDRERTLGLAVFAAPDYFHAFRLPEPVEPEARLETSFHIAPLVTVLSTDHEAIVVKVGREDGVVYLLRRGRLKEVADRSEEIQGQHGQGGWSQARYQRSIEHDFHEHLEQVAQVLARLSRQERWPIVLLGPEESKGDVLHALEAADGSLPALVAGWGAIEHHASVAELEEAALPLLEQWWVAEEGRLLDTWQEAASSPGGRGVGGWEEVAGVASDGRVELLLYYAPQDREAHELPNVYECPRCGRLEPKEGSCPLDGSALRQTNGLDGVVRETLRYGGRIWAVRHDERLAPVGGVGALLRF